MFIPQSDTNKVLAVAESGDVTARLTPRQMPLPFKEGVKVVNEFTGEVLNG